MTADTKNQRWYSPEDRLPERNQRVRWTNSAGDVTTGTFMGVWMMDNGMYIYYQPTLWQPE